jgi:HSP20 family protein
MPFFRKKKRDSEEPEDPFEYLFGDLERMQKAMDEMMKSSFGQSFMGEDMFRKLKDMKIEPGKPAVYGFSMTVGPDGKPKFEQFGNVKPSEKEVTEEREPLVDIINKPAEISVIAELPGVDKGDIKVHVADTKNKLVIDVPGKFHKEVKLPAKVKTQLGKAHYKNGVLEIDLTKEKEDKPLAGNIPVE